MGSKANVHVFNCITARPLPVHMHGKHTSCTLHLEVIELARLRARHEPRPVHGDAQKRAWSVEGAALLEAQRRAVALGELVVLVERTVALLQQRKRACGACVKEDMNKGARRCIRFVSGHLRPRL